MRTGQITRIFLFTLKHSLKIKAEDFLEDSFLKQFKNGKEFMSFMDQMYKRG